MENIINGISLFSGAGIAEAYLSDLGVNIIVANELVEKRARLYESLYGKGKMITGNILSSNIYKKIINNSPPKIDFLLASPPCQGLSIAGKNRKTHQMSLDERNHLILKVIDVIRKKNPDYVLIENVPSLLKLELPYKKKLTNIIELLRLLFQNEYIIDPNVLDASNYGVPQKRERAIIKLYKKGLKWGWPEKESKISVEKAIGHLPSLEAGEKSELPWHFARNHIDKHILWMKNTPTGKSAFHNAVFFPQKEDGTRIIGYESSYRRIKWDEPAPTITIRNDAISSQRNVHPGRRLADGTYSDARVLTPLELMILSSLPCDWNIPEDTSEILIRQCIGESIPPLLVKKIIEMIGR